LPAESFVLARPLFLMALVFSTFPVEPAGADVGGSSSSVSHIALPSDGDEYSKLVARAALGDSAVDFRALRFAYLKSAARKRNGGLGADEDLRGALFKAAKSGDNQAMRDAAEKLLSASFIDLDGQNLLNIACVRLHDEACAKQSQFMAFGLLKSIVDSGDGKTCKTGWEVVSVAEEYVVLGVLDVSPKTQSLTMGTPSCDVMATEDKDGKESTFFFRIDVVLEDEHALLGGAR
jgi:hypothetical protein